MSLDGMLDRLATQVDTATEGFDLQRGLGRLRDGQRRLREDQAEAHRIDDLLDLVDAGMDAYRLGELAQAAGDLDQAETHFKHAALVDHGDAAYRLAIILERQADLELTIDRRSERQLIMAEAVAWYERAHWAGVPYCAFALARLHGDAGQSFEAERWRQEAVVEGLAPTVERPEYRDPLVHAADRRSLPHPVRLFQDDPARSSTDDVGYRGPAACAAAGVTYRQLDYWVRTGLVVPSLRGASEGKSRRLYSFRDVLELRIVRNLLEAGVALHNIRAVIDHLRRCAGDLTDITLISDGDTVYECTMYSDMYDLVQGGQGVFAIALGNAVTHVREQLAELESERLDVVAVPSEGSAGGYQDPSAMDDLATPGHLRSVG